MEILCLPLKNSFLEVQGQLKPESNPIWIWRTGNQTQGRNSGNKGIHQQNLENMEGTMEGLVNTQGEVQNRKKLKSKKINPENFVIHPYIESFVPEISFSSII